MPLLMVRAMAGGWV